MRLIALFGMCVLGAGSWELGVSAHDPITTKVTWVREISPLLERRCGSCHRGGGYAGFSLETYEEARPWAVAIKEEVLAGEMPPWGAAPGVGHFANDRRPTRHELELIAAWVDGGAPYSLEARTPPVGSGRQSPAAGAAGEYLAGGVTIPLAPGEIVEATQRTASVTLQLPAGMVLGGWTFEPGTPGIVERVDLELGSRWFGTWTPGERTIEFPADAGVPLTTSALFTARIAYREPFGPVIDRSRIRVWIVKETRPKTIREVTVVRSWRAPADVDVVALRPTSQDGDAQVVARFGDGRAELLGTLRTPSHGPHPTYRLARPMSLPLGARIETTGAVRLLYSAAATRTVNPNVRRRPRR